MAGVELKWKKTALLVMDMQNDFISPGSPMHLQSSAAIVPSVIKAVEVARSREIPVIWVVREHDPLGRDVELFRRHLYATDKPKPAAKGSKGAELVDGLVIKDGDYKLAAGVNNVIIIGVQTPNCIRQTVFDAVALDFHEVVGKLVRIWLLK